MDETALNDLLECSVCLERLDIQNKVLPCQHTFCKKCLEEILQTQKELRCPECRVLVNVRIDDLPPNVLLVRILEGMRNTPRGKENKCNPTGEKRVSSMQPPPVLLPQPAEPPRVAPPIIQNQVPYSERGAIRSHPLPPQQVLQPVVAQQQQRQDLTIPQIDLDTPCAKALYNFEAQEPGDLSFKKGDLVQLKRQIDPNWYLGELRGQQGFFPATYVQVLVPLPAHLPMCKALYDFKMSNDDEKDCLSFSKGDSILVIRRIDENWVEGKLNERIGIFPISFVEMNGVAKAMMKAFVGPGPASSRPTPSISDMAPRPTTSAVSSSAFSFVTRSLQLFASQLTTSTPSSSELFTSSSSTGTENTSMTQSHSPMSGSILGPLPVFGQRVNGMSNSLQIPPSPPVVQPMTTSLIQRNEQTNQNEPRVDASPPASNTAPNTHCKLPVRTREKRLSYNIARSTPSSPTRESNRRSLDVGNPAPLNSPANEGSPLVSHTRNNSHPTDSSVLENPMPKTPELYIALYPYKPQKPDEIELKKGSLYSVTEKCRDGWFIGESIRTRQTGVFPGNYVQPLRSRTGAVNPQPGQTSREPTGQTSPQPPSVTQRENHQPAQAVPLVPQQKQNRRHTTAQFSTPANRRSRAGAPELPPRTSVQRTPNTTPKRQAPSPKSAPSSRRGSRCEADAPGARLMSPRKHSGRGPEVELLSVQPLDKLPPPAKEKVSIIQRLTRKKAAPAGLFSLENPVFEDGTGGSNPASGACSPVPSQPLHTRLRGLDGAPSAAKHGRDQSPTSVVSEPLPASNKKSSKQPMPPMRERYRCVTAYPPNSEHELELRVGDTIYVHKKRDDGWLKGTSQRTGRTGLFPSIFAEPM